MATDVPRQRSQQAHEDQSDQFIEVAKQLLESRPDIRVRDIAAAAHILVTVTRTMMRWIAHDAPAFLDTNVLIDETVAMLSGYITH